MRAQQNSQNSILAAEFKNFAKIRRISVFLAILLVHYRLIVILRDRHYGIRCLRRFTADVVIRQCAFPKS